MEVKGSLTQTIRVDISEIEIFRALTKVFNVYEYFSKSSCFEGYWELEEKENTEVLNKYMDTSYHGSSDYECVETITDIKKIEAYKLIKDLIELYGIDLKKYCF